MQLFLRRKWKTDKSSIGELFIDGEFECYTLEDVDRDSAPKVYGQTAIPEGLYHVILNHSERFNRELPLLLDVPGFQGIRIHDGNTDKDTLGCILVGQFMGKDFIGQSRAALAALMAKLKDEK